jgi:hypothetical protein
MCGHACAVRAVTYEPLQPPRSGSPRERDKLRPRYANAGQDEGDRQERWGKETETPRQRAQDAGEGTTQDTTSGPATHEMTPAKQERPRRDDLHRQRSPDERTSRYPLGDA